MNVADTTVTNIQIGAGRDDEINRLDDRKSFKKEPLLCQETSIKAVF